MATVSMSSFAIGTDCSAVFLSKGLESLACFDSSYQESGSRYRWGASHLSDRSKLGRKRKSFDHVEQAKQGRKTDAASLSLHLRGGAGGVEGKKAKSGAQILTQAENLYKTAVSGPSEKDATIWSCLFAAVAFVMGGTDDRVLRRDEKLEDAGDLFTQASNKFKLERKWKEAGEALIRSGDCYQRHSSMGYEAANKYADAAKLFKKELPDEAVSALERAVAALEHSPDDNLQRAARIHRDLGELHELRGRFKEAADQVWLAVELLEAEGAWVAAESLEVRVADLRVLADDLPVAAEAYEDLGNRALRSDLKSCGGREAQELWFRASLCLLAQGALREMEEASVRFEVLDVTYAGSSKAEAARALLEALAAPDPDAFAKQARELGDTLLGDKAGVALLNKIRQVVRREGEAGGRVSEAVAQEDDDDLL